jgi:2-polyprenyl-3-methyl-5-hydroxy-6-metoxy-1,4-benzoquinol methylase
MLQNAPHEIYERRLRRMLESLSDLKPKAKILDIGCQSGSFCAELHRLGHEPYGIEIDSKSVQDARAMTLPSECVSLNRPGFED